MKKVKAQKGSARVSDSPARQWALLELMPCYRHWLLQVGLGGHLFEGHSGPKNWHLDDFVCNELFLSEWLYATTCYYFDEQKPGMTKGSVYGVLCASILLVINKRQLFLEGPRVSEVHCWNRFIFLKIVSPTKKQWDRTCLPFWLQLFFKKSKKLHCCGLGRSAKLWGQLPKQHSDPFLLFGRADLEPMLVWEILIGHP